ncbi:hypothetical protein [Oceanobacillus sojae]|uniref:hypothetical protein n=1 Tax=Oceanobacillus sojae TaxID=582851 RepID=UPI0021A6CD5F|nr:hypothetical protein [Oceanobacillus sojae]MCT1902467.1 hypothetical protein [Oceanobacillus sojae]
MLHALAKTADILNENNIIWGLGGSLMLHMHGIIDNPNDIDLLVSENHAPLAGKVLDNLGERKETVHLIEQHFKEKGINHPDLLIKALRQPLPEPLRNKIQYFLSLEDS